MSDGMIAGSFLKYLIGVFNFLLFGWMLEENGLSYNLNLLF